MIRHLFLFATIGLTGCAEPPPEVRVDGDTLNHAIQHAQAQAELPGHAATRLAEVRK